MQRMAKVDRSRLWSYGGLGRGIAIFTGKFRLQFVIAILGRWNLCFIEPIANQLRSGGRIAD
jgi:hypothetical protein